MNTGDSIALELIMEFRQNVHSILGVFLDGTMGLGLLRKHFDKVQREALRLVDDLDVSSLDATDFLYGKGDPNSPDAIILHKAKQADFKARIQQGSKNETFLGNMCLVMIYQYWEDHYRLKIAKALGMEDKDDLKCAIMGDVRHLRRSIIHNNGIAVPEVNNCELLKWFAPGDHIMIDQSNLEELVQHIDSCLEELGHQASTL